MAARNPVCTSPLTSASASTRTPSKLTSAVIAPSCPIFLSLGPTATPGVSAGTRNTATLPSSSAVPSEGPLTLANVTNRSAHRRVRDEPLLTVYGPTVAGPARGAAHPRRVRTRLGFGQRERRDDPTLGHRLKPPLLLRVGAVADQHLSGDPVVGAEHRPERQRRVTELQRQVHVLGDRQAQAAVLLGDARSRRVPSPRPAAAGRPGIASCRRSPLARHDLVPQEPPDLRQDRGESSAPTVSTVAAAIDLSSRCTREPGRARPRRSAQ